MKRISFVALLATAFVLVTGCSQTPTATQSEIASPVSVRELAKGSISKLVNTSGSALPFSSADLTSETEGKYHLQNNPATGKPFRLGDKVQKGQIVVKIENKEYVNNIAYESKKLNLEIAEQEQTKQDTLYKLGGVTLSEMRNTEVKVINARTDIDNATINLAKMELRAPFSGVITDLPHYTPDVQIATGKPIFSIMDYSKMYMDVNMPESAIAYVRAGQPVYITHYTLPGDTLQGVISELSPAISQETRTFKGKITISNDELKLRPGMYVKADIIVDRADSSIIIPKEIIQSTKNSKYVFVAEKNTAVQRDITIGLEDEKNAEIVSGLSEGDNLIIKGYETLRRNSKVKIQQ